MKGLGKVSGPFFLTPPLFSLLPDIRLPNRHVSGAAAQTGAVSKVRYMKNVLSNCK
jgi:hypothetical protein